MNRAAILTTPTGQTTNNPVTNIIKADASFCEFAYPGQWVDISDPAMLCDVGWLWTGSGFTPPT